jgi:hypothetical protein
MRRMVIGLLVVVAFAGLFGAGRVSLGTAAQDAATPAAAAIHPSVGTWIVDSQAGPMDPPEVVVNSADGGVVSTGAGGAIAGTWEATGPRTTRFILVVVFEEEGAGGYVVIRGDSEVDASGETMTGSYTWTDVAADGTVGETGQDVTLATRLSVSPADVMEGPLAEVPTWTPAMPEAGTPTS